MYYGHYILLYNFLFISYRRAFMVKKKKKHFIQYLANLECFDDLKTIHVSVLISYTLVYNTI